MRFDVSYNYYFPFYTMEKRGQKKYWYLETIFIHISDDFRLKFNLTYKKGKLNEIEFDKVTRGEYNYYAKDVIHLSYVEFATKVNIFQNFLNRGLKSLYGDNAYKKIIVFSELYKFNREFELTFGYSKMTLKKDVYDHQIIDEKKVKSKKEKVSISEEWDKVDKIIDAWNDNTVYKEISNKVFHEELNDFYIRFSDYLKCPKKLFKKEYKPDRS